RYHSKLPRRVRHVSSAADARRLSRHAGVRACRAHRPRGCAGISRIVAIGSGLAVAGDTRRRRATDTSRRAMMMPALLSAALAIGVGWSWQWAILSRAHRVNLPLQAALAIALGLGIVGCIANLLLMLSAASAVTLMTF